LEIEGITWIRDYSMADAKANLALLPGILFSTSHTVDSIV
jgi:hypothetical protein